MTDNNDINKRSSYLVVQGNFSKDEYKNGFLWAPFIAKNGSKEHSWERLEEVNIGDRIYHYSKGKIIAVSVADSTWYKAARPETHGYGDESRDDGRRIDCTTSFIDNPIFISDYSETISKYRKKKYSAFDKNNQINQGYLYELEPEIEAVFYEGIKNSNPDFSIKTPWEILYDNALPEEVQGDEESPIYEGAKKQITVNAYERDPDAVKKCKDYYLKRDGRLICQICGFDSGKIYGDDFSNKIHIHHIKPLNEIGEEYIVNPKTDLIPVCPNCHMILHSKNNISMDDLKKRLIQNHEESL